MEVLFLWVGIVFASLGLLILKVARAQRDRGTLTEGEVIGYVRSAARKKGTDTYAPVITYTQPDGEARVIRSSFESNQFSYHLHEKVKLCLDGSRARLATSAFFWFGGVFFAMGAGAILLFFSIFSWNPFSVCVALVVSFMIFLSVRKRLHEKSGKIPRWEEMISFVDRTLTSESQPASAFPQEELLGASELRGILLKQRNQLRIALVVTLALTVGGLALSDHLIRKQILFMGVATTTQGKVVGFHSSSDSDSTVYFPEVEFRPGQEKSPVQFRHPAGSSHPSWSVGQKVRVLYDPADPTHAMIDTGLWNWLWPAFPGIVGLLSALMSWGILANLRRIGTGWQEIGII